MPRSHKLLITLALCAGMPALADDAALAAARASITEKHPQVRAEQIHASPVDGLFEIGLGGEILYMTPDGRHMLQGDLIDLDSGINLSEQRRIEARVAALAEVDEKDMIIFAPKKVKHTITVFTDVDCAYCRKFHSQMSALNALGLRVRYVFYPRSGPDTPSWHKAEQVWCADDRNAAITAAKLDQPFETKSCDAPIMQQWELGQTVGLQGTPAIVTENGNLIPGYLPAAELVKRIESLESSNAAVARADP